MPLMWGLTHFMKNSRDQKFRGITPIFPSIVMITFRHHPLLRKLQCNQTYVLSGIVLYLRKNQFYNFV